MVTINVNTKSTPKKKTATKKKSSGTLGTAKSVTSLANSALTVDKKARDAKAARAKDKGAGTKRTCPACGNVDVSGAKKCPACNADMNKPVKKTCPACGNVDVSGAKNCPACDAKMN